jgi:hypothetical protein
MRWAKYLTNIASFGIGASIAAPTDLGAGDLLVLAFSGASVALGTVVFALLRKVFKFEFCSLNLPPGPPPMADRPLPKAA